jgi:hypothetical protein
LEGELAMERTGEAWRDPGARQPATCSQCVKQSSLCLRAVGVHGSGKRGRPPVRFQVALDCPPTGYSAKSQCPMPCCAYKYAAPNYVLGMCDVICDPLKPVHRMHSGLSRLCMVRLRPFCVGYLSPIACIPGNWRWS